MSTMSSTATSTTKITQKSLENEKSQVDFQRDMANLLACLQVHKNLLTDEDKSSITSPDSEIEFGSLSHQQKLIFLCAKRKYEYLLYKIGLIMRALNLPFNPDFECFANIESIYNQGKNLDFYSKKNNANAKLSSSSSSSIDAEAYQSGYVDYALSYLTGQKEDFSSENLSFANPIKKNEITAKPLSKDSDDIELVYSSIMNNFAKYTPRVVMANPQFRVELNHYATTAYNTLKRIDPERTSIRMEIATVVSQQSVLVRVREHTKKYKTSPVHIIKDVLDQTKTRLTNMLIYINRTIKDQNKTSRLMLPRYSFPGIAIYDTLISQFIVGQGFENKWDQLAVDILKAYMDDTKLESMWLNNPKCKTSLDSWNLVAAPPPQSKITKTKTKSNNKKRKRKDDGDGDENEDDDGKADKKQKTTQQQTSDGIICVDHFSELLTKTFFMSNSGAGVRVGEAKKKKEKEKTSVYVLYFHTLASTEHPDYKQHKKCINGGIDDNDDNITKLTKFSNIPKGIYCRVKKINANKSGGVGTITLEPVDNTTLKFLKKKYCDDVVDDKINEEHKSSQVQLQSQSQLRPWPLFIHDEVPKKIAKTIKIKSSSFAVTVLPIVIDVSVVNDDESTSPPLSILTTSPATPIITPPLAPPLPPPPQKPKQDTTLSEILSGMNKTYKIKK